MAANAQIELFRRVAGWVDDLAGHERSERAIAALGDTAIPALHEYLARGPQVVPQARCFAVAMLARLHARAATGALREVLRMHPLKSLAPPYAESEYVVKSDALEALAARDYPERADDIAFGIDERLRVAVVAAGRLRLHELANALVDVLGDDVLAEAAMESLVAIGQGAGAAIVPRLDAWLSAAALSARRRLALVRALRVLHHTQVQPEALVMRRALADEHPAVAGAAALVATPVRRDAEVIDALLHGALGFDPGLADDCRGALDDAGPGITAPAERALARNAEPDLYGTLHPLSSEQRGWLQRRLRGTDPE